MKKNTLVASSILALGIIGMSTPITSVFAESITYQSVNNSTDINGENPENIVLDQGEFDSPINLSQYNYSFNNGDFNFGTGKVVFDYSSKSLIDLDEETDRYFNLKLPSEFKLITGKNNETVLKNAITASYKLPGKTDYTNFSVSNIDTSHKGQINFTLPKTALISTNQVTNIKVQIDFGKILDDLALGSDYDYTQIIPNAKNGSYKFKGAVTSEDHFNVIPDGMTIGYTDDGEAVK